MLKMDINDEQQVETFNKKNRTYIPVIDTISAQSLVNKLTTIEKEDLANK